MKLLQKLYSSLFKAPKKISKEHNPNELCSLHISITNEDEYNFEIRWDSIKEIKAANGLSNLILGITYGLFSQDIIAILKEYNGDNPSDIAIVQNTIFSIESQIKILDNIINKNSSIDKPLIKPSEVLKHDP